MKLHEKANALQCITAVIEGSIYVCGTLALIRLVPVRVGVYRRVAISCHVKAQVEPVGDFFYQGPLTAPSPPAPHHKKVPCAPCPACAALPCAPPGGASSSNIFMDACWGRPDPPPQEKSGAGVCRFTLQFYISRK